jgi:pimeloyl-ACP methyl ester carboxylesterase
METFDFRGLPIAYVRSGRGKPVVFLHNGGASHAIWRPVVAELSTRHEAFALDLLGYGASAKPADGYTLETYTDMLGEFLDALELETVALVGNCMGSAIAASFARQHPRRVRALVLVNPLTEATFAQGYLGAVTRGPVRGISRVLVGKRLPRWMARQVLRFQLGPVATFRTLAHGEELCDCYGNEGQMRSLLAVVDDLDSYAALDAFVPDDAFPPICTIWGDANRVLSPRAGRRLNETLRPAREEWLAGCGHLPMLEQPEAVASTIASFLEARP